MTFLVSTKHTKTTSKFSSLCNRFQFCVCNLQLRSLRGNMPVHVNSFAYLFHLINQTAAFSPTCHEQFWISRIFGLVITLFPNYIHFLPFSLLIALPELGVKKCIKLIFHYLKIAFFIDNLHLTTPRHTAQSPSFDLITLLGASESCR